MGRKLTIEFCKKEALKRGCEIMESEYIGVSIKMKFYRNMCGHSFKMDWSHFNNHKQGCPLCAGNIKLTIEYCGMIAEKRNFTLKTKKYYGTFVKMRFSHNSCGYKFKMNWHDFGTGKGCPKCAGTLKPKIADCKREARQRGYILLDKKYVNSKKRMTFIHKKCGKRCLITWLGFHTSKAECITCRRIENGKKRRLSLFFCKEESYKRGFVLKENEYLNNNTKMIFTHIKCGNSFPMTWTCFYNRGQGCRFCHSSSGEIKVLSYLNSIGLKEGLDYFSEKSFDDCRYKLPLFFDFYLPKYKLLIEYNGRQHYKPVRFSNSISEEQSIKNLKEQKRRDRIKRNYCRNRNYSLLIVPFDKNVNKILSQYFEENINIL